MESGTRIAFLGGGNMARALIGGLVAAGHTPAALQVFDLDPEKSAALQQDLGITVSAEANDLLGAEALVLAVKPQHMQSALTALQDGLRAPSRPLLISIAAGIPLAALERWSATSLPVIRCMPNTPALVGAGASVLLANASVSDDQRELAAQILAAVGAVFWIESESHMDAVTAVSGSGPAYFFLFQELLEYSAIAAGLPRELAEQLVRQTAVGAARLAASSPLPVAQLRTQVTSPGGTTERALQELQNSGLDAILERAVLAARDRSVELAQELDKQT